MFVSKFTEVYFIAVYFESKLYAQFSETFFDRPKDTADRRTDALLYQYRASALRVHCRADAEGDINEFATIKSFNYITLDHWFESGAIFCRAMRCIRFVNYVVMRCPSIPSASTRKYLQVHQISTS